MPLTRFFRHPYVTLVAVILAISSLLWFFAADILASSPPDQTGQGEVRLTENDQGRQVQLGGDQVLVIDLPGNPSTGYIWEIAEPEQKGGGQVLRQVGGTEFKPQVGVLGGKSLIGASGRQILRLVPVVAGQATLQLVYHRPWEQAVKPVQTFTVQVQTTQPSNSANNLELTPTAEPAPDELAATPAQPALGLPTAFNRCDYGECTVIKDQKQCGSCWTFATVAPLESSILRVDAATRDLSEQYLLSCNTEGWNCSSGGWWGHGYHLNLIPPGETAAGAVYEANFPYVASDVACNAPHPHHEKIASWAYVGSEYSVPSTDSIKQAIFDYGPVAAAVCSGSNFSHYTGGVFQTEEKSVCSGGVNHAIVLVGWDDTRQAWRLRNSWGTSWGESGYMWIKYGVSNVGYGASYITYSSGGCPDNYEVDNTSTSAKSVWVNGGGQHHTFHVANDVDWAKFSATAGKVYTVTTSNLDSGNNTALALYNTDGATLLTSTDNCPGPEACLYWTAPGSGNYFIRAAHSSGAGNCTGYGYDLSVASNDPKVGSIYLPLVVKSSSCSEAQVVQNGGFESGGLAWTQSSGPYSIIGNGSGYFHHSGAWGSWFGGYDDANDHLYQTINIPAGVSSARLVIYLYIASEEAPDYPYDYFHVELQNASGTTLETFLWADNRLKNASWYQGTKSWTNFSPYAGQTLRLFFEGTTDYSLVTDFFMDDVQLRTYCGSLPAASGEAVAGDGWNWQPVQAPPGYSPEPVPLRPKGDAQ